MRLAPMLLLLCTASLALAAEPDAIRITAAEAVAKKLPAARIELKAKGLGLTLSKLPDATTYLRLSGPPGGPLGMVFAPYTGEAEAANVRAVANRSIEKPFALAAPEEVRIGRRKLWGIAYAAASGQARAQGCVVLYPAAKAKRGVAVRFWTGARASGTATCSAVLGSAPFQKIFRTLKLVAE